MLTNSRFINLKKHNQPAFTLIEVVLTIAIVAIVAGFSFPVGASLIREDEVVNVASLYNSKLFEYQQYSYANKNGDDYRVCFDNSNNNIKFGTITAPDEVLSTIDTKNVPFSNIQDTDGSPDCFDFSTKSFKPESGFSVTFGETGKKQITVEINSEGLIDYYTTP